MPTNVKAFNAAVRRAAKEKLPDEFVKFHRELTLDALREIVQRWPVGNPDLWKSPAPSGYVGGRSRGAWQASVAKPATTEKQSANPVSEARGALAGLRLGQSTFLSNPVEYAIALEEGHSTQAPEGAVAVTFARLARKIKRT